MEKSVFRRGEQGITLIGLLLWAVVVVFVLLLTAKIFPVYYDYWSVVTAVKSQAQNADANASDKDIRDALLKRLDVAGVKDISPEDISIERDQQNNELIRVEYQRKVKLIGNVSMLFDFETHANASQAQGT